MFNCLCYSIVVELDVSPPVVDCDTVTVSFSSNGRTQCQLDHGNFRNCKSPYSRSGLRGGQHTITIRATDGRSGYVQKTATFAIVLGMVYCHLLVQ